MTRSSLLRCEAVTSPQCEWPANLEDQGDDEPKRLKKCYRCGRDVCGECSRITPRASVRNRPARICGICRDEGTD